MCRNKVIREKRCACSHGPLRNVLDRVRYATKQASSLTTAPDPAKTSPPPGLPPTADVKKGARTVGKAITDLTKLSRRNDAVGLETEWAVVERQVREIGVRVEQDAAEIAGFTAEDVVADHNLAAATFDRSLKSANRQVKKFEANVDALAARLTALRGQSDGADFDKSEDAVMAAMSELQDAIDARSTLLATTAETYGITPATEAAIMKAFAQGTYTHLQDRLARLASARAEAIRRIRPMGGTIEADNELPRTLRTTMDFTAQVYPTAWIDASNRQGDLRIRRTRDEARAQYHPHTFKREKTLLVEESYLSPDADPPAGKSWEIDPDGADESGNVRWIRPLLSVKRARGWEDGESVTGPVPKGWSERRVYNPNGDIIRVFVKPKETTIEVGEAFAQLTVDNDIRPGQWQPDKGLSTAIHEFAHRIEHVNPAVGYLEKAFHDRRTTTASGEREPLTNLYGSAREMGRIDSFANGYIGKEYGHAPGYVYSYEVLSTGMEALFAGQHGSLSGLNGMTADPDHRAFILGALATA